MNDLVVMTFAFLLPLIPSYILYTLLPGETKVGGPFKGLTVQLSGAFAGYFLLTLMAFGYLGSRPTPRVGEDWWEVKGKIDQSDIDMNRLHVRVMDAEPPSYKIAGGQIRLQVQARADMLGKLKLPILVIEDDDNNAENVTIDLNEDGSFLPLEWKLDKDPKKKAIAVKDIPKIRRKTLSSAPNAIAQPVPAPADIGGSK